jgi:hypothetical protein
MKRYSFIRVCLFILLEGFLPGCWPHWRGTGLLYIFIALLLVWIPTVIRMQVGFSRFAAQEGSRFTQQIPHITIRKGQVSTDVTTPYFIKGDDGKPLVIIDHGQV